MNDMYDLIDDEPTTVTWMLSNRFDQLTPTMFQYGDTPGQWVIVQLGSPIGKCLIYKLLIDKGWWPHE